jgi:hypothetical protein
MPIPSPYQSFSEICLDQGVGYEQWQKTGEADKIVNLLYDQIMGPSSAATRSGRALALYNYLDVKNAQTNPLFADDDAATRLAVLQYTYTNALTIQSQGQFGLCGRFDRVLVTVLNEMSYTGAVATQAAIVALWVVGVKAGVAAGSGVPDV